MKKLLTAALASAALTSPALASVTADLDKNLVIYKNDGDGMQYVIEGGEKITVRYKSLLERPLGKDARPRYSVDNSGNEPVYAAVAKPGPAGLRWSRPMADVEIAKVQEGLLKYTEARGSSGLALDPDADPGPVQSHFDAWHSASREDCKITIYEKAMDVCGTKLGRAGFLNWTMFKEGGYNAFGFVGTHNFTIGFRSREGRRAVSFRFAHNGTAARFVQELTAWSGTTLRRV